MKLRGYPSNRSNPHIRNDIWKLDGKIKHTSSIRRLLVIHNFLLGEADDLAVLKVKPKNYHCVERFLWDETMHYLSCFLVIISLGTEGVVASSMRLLYLGQRATAVMSCCHVIMLLYHSSCRCRTNYNLSWAWRDQLCDILGTDARCTYLGRTWFSMKVTGIIYIVTWLCRQMFVGNISNHANTSRNYITQSLSRSICIRQIYIIVRANGNGR
jgi:hypothetical protein